MAQLENYKCPACLGPLHFSSETGRLQCEYCGSSYSVEEIELAQNHESPLDDWEAQQQNLQVYSCPSCGGELYCDQNTAATCCPYCGNPAVIPGKLQGILKPDYVIPFLKSKEDAVKALQQHYRKKLLLPRVFSAQNHIQEVQGLYVPFWLFDRMASGSVQYSATRSRSYRDGDYQVTETDHYQVFRDGSLDFLMVPIDGSQKLPDDLMDSLSPYDYKALTEFSPAYLPGYLADKYDVDADTASQRAEERCLNTLSDALQNTVQGYSSVNATSSDLQIDGGSHHYALLPVWLLTTRWQGKTYLFAMNGQTGKLVGNLPIDPNRKRALFYGSFVTVSLLLSLLFAGPLGRMLFRLFGL